jgi:predicted Ser/Thr protein kinase
MTSQQRQRVRDLFEAALDRDAGARVAWAVEQAGSDAAVRDEVVSLLNHHVRAGSFLDEPILDRLPGLLADDGVLAPGTIVGSYTIVRELGRGGMGRVYLASDARLGRNVALKALAPHLTRHSSHRDRLRREARAAAALTHPGICTVYALEEIDDELFIAAEFIDGHTLREEIAAARRPSSEEILRTAREIAAALASAHAQGTAHRDLKPENVMRTRDGRLKVLDFGLARLDAGSVPAMPAPSALATEPGVLIGTPGYMAPEQVNGQRGDTRTDVFAFGVLLYEYICGAHPFEGATALATIARVLESDARPLGARAAHAPNAVVALVERCLRKAPEDRFGSAAEIAAVLEQSGDAGSPGSHAMWWRVHQVVIMALYIAAATLAWWIKEWIDTPTTVSLFFGLGIGGTIGGVLRGHLLFTEWMNRAHLATERRRAGTPLKIVDVLLASALVADATFLAAWPFSAVMTMSLALGIALAALVLETATNRAVFGDALNDRG